MVFQLLSEKSFCRIMAGCDISKDTDSVGIEMCEPFLPIISSWLTFLQHKVNKGVET